MKYIGLFDEKEDIVTKEKLETKQDIITGAATTITNDNLTASRTLVSDASGKVAVSPVTSTELGYLDGVTSSVQTQLNKKLETVHDNDMLWGGQNLSGNVSPTDAAMVSVIGGNKFALCKPQGITIEYTNDGGVTWVDYEATEKTKIDVISGISTVGLYYGKKTASSQIVTADDMLRITVNAFTCGVYTSLRKILIEFATNGSTNDFVKIESATIGDQETFTVVGTYNVSGNSGWNSIPYANNFGAYSLNQASNVGVLRFTFSTGTASSYTGRPYVQNLVLNGITNYVNPSKLSATGHLYSYDYQQNATFPANITATKFIGDGSNLTNIPYPVTSVNTKTGAVTLSASDVGAQPTITVNGIIKGDGAGNLSAQDTVAAELVDLPTIPTKVSELTNDANYITAAQAPVQSVNNKTGTVSLTASDVSAIPSTLTGTAGQVLTKTADGQEWATAPVDENSVLLKDAYLNLPSSSSWTAVAYGNNLFVAVATGTAMGAYSSDGVNWNISTLPVVGNWSAIASNGTWFIAVQTGSNIYIQSSDGINWVQGDFNYNGVLDDIGSPARDWVDIGYGTIKSGSRSDNVWIAINRYVSTWSVRFSVFYSFASGQTTEWYTPTQYPNKEIDPFSVCFGTLNPSSGRLGFVIFPNGNLIYSSEASTGLDQGTYRLPASGEWKASAYGNGKFVALMKGSNQATYDTDVFTWKSVTLPLTANWCSAAYGSDKFVAIAENSNTAIYSNDGITWNTTNLPSMQNWKCVVYGNGQFLAVASDSDVVAVSTDGIHWVSAMKKLQYPDGTDIHEQVKEALQIAAPDVPQPSATTPLAPTEAGAVGTSTAYARGDHVHPKQTVTKADVGLGNVDNVSINTRLNRTTNVNAADANYTTYMARGEALFSTETTPTVNGCIAWQYG